jgi:hypothetical protein
LTSKFLDRNRFLAVFDTISLVTGTTREDFGPVRNVSPLQVLLHFELHNRDFFAIQRSLLLLLMHVGLLLSTAAAGSVPIATASITNVTAAIY